MQEQIIVQSREHLKRLLEVELYVSAPEISVVEAERRYAFLLQLCDADFSQLAPPRMEGLICHKCKQGIKDEEFTWCPRCGLELHKGCLPPETDGNGLDYGDQILLENDEFRRQCRNRGFDPPDPSLLWIED
jgi:hypothetical protein